MYGGARGGGKTDPFIREIMAIHNIFLEGKITEDEEKKLIRAAADRRFGKLTLNYLKMATLKTNGGQRYECKTKLEKGKRINRTTGGFQPAGKR